MRDAYVLLETWQFECLRCEQAFERHYECRHCPDGHGGEGITYLLGGLPAMSPWSEPVCPECGGLNVKARPTTRETPRPRPRAEPPPSVLRRIQPSPQGVHVLW